MDSITGQLLVASRHLHDPNFLKSVVLVIQHNEEGALGLILNQPTDTEVADVWESVGGGQCDNEDSVFMGGPVPGPIMVLHGVESLGETEVVPGVFISTEKDTLDQLVCHKHVVRVFTHHSGWGGGQLEAEMEVGGWLTCPATAEDIWSDPETIWGEVTSRIGLEIMASDIPADQVPKDPNWN